MFDVQSFRFSGQVEFHIRNDGSKVYPPLTAPEATRVQGTPFRVIFLKV